MQNKARPRYSWRGFLFILVEQSLSNDTLASPYGEKNYVFPGEVPIDGNARLSATA
jgi:hypothetical protein